MGLLTLLDVAKRNDSDPSIGLIEEVNTIAPELTVLRGRTIPGITYKFTKRTTLPGGPAFRNANEGSLPISSVYTQDIGECFFLDGQLQVDEMVVTSGEAEGNSAADILTDEAIGATKSQLIRAGDQFYRGVSADTKGFIGMQNLYDTVNCEIDAQGTTSGARSSAYLVWNDLQGVHWVFGMQLGIGLGEWTKQQVVITAGTPNKTAMAYVNNIKGWLGLAFGHSKSVVRIKNIEDAANKGLTDKLVAKALTKMPQQIVGSGNVRLFMNRTAAYTLQSSRSTNNGALTTKTDSQPLVFASVPVESNGIPIIITDSLPQTE